MNSLIPEPIRNITSSNFVSFGYNYLFKTMFPSIKNGKLIIEINDANYPEYCTNLKGNHLEFGNDTIDGSENAKITISNLYRFLSKTIFGHDIGFAESFILGDFIVDDLTKLIKIFILNINELDSNKNMAFNFLNEKIYKVGNLINKWVNESSRDKIKSVYNLGNEFYKILLGETMIYTPGHYNNPTDTLSEVQYRKAKLLIEKLNLTENDHLLEIGCGWGFLSCQAVKLTGCKVTGISISTSQLEYCKENILKQGKSISDRVDYQYMDYRDLLKNKENYGKFDRVVAVGMLEHVEVKNQPEYFNIIDKVLKKDGLLILDFITYSDYKYNEMNMDKKVGFINTYIFPGGCLPSITCVVNSATNGSTFELQYLESSGPHYGLTIDAWKDNLLANKNEIIEKLGHDEQFIKTFEYYLAYCSAGFQLRYINNVQMIYSRPLNTKNYKEIIYNPYV